MTNIEKALALITTFATGDTEKAASLLAEGYIQHNLAYGTGRDAFVGSVAWLASAPVKTTVQNIRAFEDGDKVFLQTVYNFAGAGEQVAFDIFRFDADGKIAEHWDNLAAKADPNPSGHTQIDGCKELKDLDRTEANRELVKNFLADVLQGRHPEKTPEYFDGDTYIQHNTGIADGLSGLGSALAALAEQGIQMIYTTVHQVLAQGNYVLAVSEGISDSHNRLPDRKIVRITDCNDGNGILSLSRDPAERNADDRKVMVGIPALYLAFQGCVITKCNGNIG